MNYTVRTYDASPARHGRFTVVDEVGNVVHVLVHRRRLPHGDAHIVIDHALRTRRPKPEPRP